MVEQTVETNHVQNNYPYYPIGIALIIGYTVILFILYKGKMSRAKSRISHLEYTNRKVNEDNKTLENKIKQLDVLLDMLKNKIKVLEYNNDRLHVENNELHDDNNSPPFNVLDIETWEYASDSAFVWKDDSKFFNIDTGNDITEKEFTEFIGKAIESLRQVSTDEKISVAGLSNIIALLIDLLSAGINANNALLIINYGLENKINFSWQVSKADQTTGGNSESFDINNQDTWKFATENNLIWEGVPFNISPEKIFTEVLFVKIMALIFYEFLQILYSKPDLRNVTISTLLEGLKQDKNIADIVNQILNMNTPDSTDNRVFDISDISTWEFASEQYIIWNNKLVYNKDEIPITEKEAVNLFNSIYTFLERNGEKLTSDYKIEKAKGLLNRLANPIESNNEEQISEPRNEAFNPRNPETYQFATNNQLILDGIPVYKEYERNGDTIKEPETEKDFTRYISMSLGVHKELQPDFTEQEYIASHIANKLEQCSPMPPIVKALGGYGFTQAQIEVLGSLSDEDLAEIGKTMSGGLRGSKLKQALFNVHGSLNRDWHYLVELCDLNVAWEKKIMSEYFLGYEFETEEEVNKLLDESEYLKDHNEIKVEIYEYFKERFIDDYFTELYDNLEIKEEINKLINRNEYLEHHSVFKADLLNKFEELILKDREEQSRSMDIKNFAIHDDIKQLLWFADGPLKNLTKEQMAHDKDAISLKLQFEPDDPRVAMCEELNVTIDEPSLIYTKKAIIQPQDNVLVPYYSPEYKDLSPEQRWMYLKFLADPYNTNFDIGYVFILYYGLERHLLQGNFDDAFKVIIKLRDIHTNKSFQKYSGNAVILSSLLKNKGEYAIEFIKSLDADYKFGFSDNLLLLCYYSFNIPLLPKDLMRMAKTFEFTKTNYIKKSPDVFEKCLLNITKEKTGSENIDIKKYIPDSELDNLSYENTSVYINSSITGNTIPVPMLTGNSKLKNEIKILLESAHESTKVKLAEMRKVARKATKSEEDEE